MNENITISADEGSIDTSVIDDDSDIEIEGGSEDGGDNNGGDDVSSMEDYDTSDGSILIASFAQRAYLAYAMSVVKGRALPSIEDGQKPVQRRILFVMKEMGNWHDSPYKKSARIIGDVLGKYHPHGDSSVYEAAVRMAQDFTLRYPLIDGQGNFGSRDGDSAAAMRYTEVRLSKFAEEILLSEMDRGTIDFVDNYDGTMKEPALLPARLPVMLLNGATGIAVGMATDIPSHNLVEVAGACCELLQLENAGETLTDDRILDLIPGPDFSGGSHVISSPDEIRNIYMTGRGSLRVRAKWTIEHLARGQWQVVITELSPSSFDSKDIGNLKVTGTARVLAEIDELISPKFEKGKKTLSLKQQSLKASILSMLEKARDDSDEKHPIRIILEPKTSKVSCDEMMALLLANTCLEGNVKVNLVSIGRDGTPLQKSFPTILREWTTFRKDVVERRLRFRYEEVKRRVHILDGRMIVFLNIDEVIQVIRHSDDPKADLIARFNLSEVQAEDILEIRLRQLARLEGIKIEQELARLREEQANLEFLLGNESARRDLIIGEIKADIAKYGDHRRTLIQESERVTTSKAEVIVDEPITVILSKNGYIRCRSGHEVDASTLNWKAGDSALAIVQTRSVLPIVLIGSNGRTYTLKSTEIPGGKGDGLPVTSLIELSNAKISYLLSDVPERKVLISTDSGYGFICTINDMVSRQKAGKRFLTVDENDTILPPEFVGDSDKLLAISSDFKGLIFPISEVKELGGGKGVIIMATNDGEKLLLVKPYKTSVTISGELQSGKPMIVVINQKNDEKWVGKRAKKGSALPVKFKTINLASSDK